MFVQSFGFANATSRTRGSTPSTTSTFACFVTAVLCILTLKLRKPVEVLFSEPCLVLCKRATRRLVMSPEKEDTVKKEGNDTLIKSWNGGTYRAYKPDFHVEKLLITIFGREQIFLFK